MAELKVLVMNMPNLDDDCEYNNVQVLFIFSDNVG